MTEWSWNAAGITVGAPTTVVAPLELAAAERPFDLRLLLTAGGTSGTVRLLADNGAGAVSTLASGSYSAAGPGLPVPVPPTVYADPQNFSYTVAVDLAPGAVLYGVEVASSLPGASLVFIDPARVVDTRRPDGGGPIAGGQDRSFTVDLIVPRGAWGPLLNVTLDQTAGAGYLVFFPTGEGDIGSPPPISNVNWYTTNQIVANLVITQMAGEADVAVHAGGPGSTHFIVDVLGYFV